MVSLAWVSNPGGRMEGADESTELWCHPWSQFLPRIMVTILLSHFKAIGRCADSPDRPNNPIGYFELSAYLKWKLFNSHTNWFWISNIKRNPDFYQSKMDQITQYVEPLRQFSKDSIRLVKRCTKPDRKEFQKIAVATAIGFAIMGFIGFFVKLIHIPINNIIVGA